jgi:DNA-binding LacI/PurR family transcriptional regulator
MASATLSSELARECAATGNPVVMFNRYFASSPASNVTCDNIEGGRKAGGFLVRGGHQRIAFIAGAEDSSTNRDREAGFYKGLAEHGVAVFPRTVCGYTFEGAKRATRELFRAKLKPDAIFVANDHMAFAVMDVLRHELALRILKDVSIIGYDDVPEASWQAYDLTTVTQSAAKMVDATARILLEQIEKSQMRKRARVMSADLVMHGSVMFPKGSLR